MSSGWTVGVGASKACSKLTDPQIRLAFNRFLPLWSFLASRSPGLLRADYRIDEIVRSASSSLLRDEPINLKRTGLREVDHALTAFESAASSIIDRERRHSLLVDELNHRVKNTLAVVQSMALLAKQTATSVSDFSNSFVSRIVSLAHTHDLLTARNWDTVQLKEIFENELRAYQSSDRNRLSLSGRGCPGFC